MSVHFSRFRLMWTLFPYLFRAVWTQVSVWAHHSGDPEITGLQLLSWQMRLPLFCPVSFCSADVSLTVGLKIWWKRISFLGLPPTHSFPPSLLQGMALLVQPRNRDSLPVRVRVWGYRTCLCRTRAHTYVYMCEVCGADVSEPQQ